MKNIFLSLGSNLGNREANLNTALEEISEFFTILNKSKIHETEPEDYLDQAKFLNMAIEIETELTPVELIFKLQEIEHKMGRQRTVEKGPRIIDLDIIFYDNKTVNSPNLKIPHPRAHLRNFVLIPMKEIAPNYLHPGLKQDINTLYEKLKDN